MVTTQAFPKTNRITTAKQYKALFTKAKKQHFCAFTVYVSNNNANIARLGIIVAKRNQKTAVARNRTKRIVRESFRINKTNLHGLDLVIVAKQNINNLPLASLKNDLENAWSRSAAWLKQ